MSAKDISVHNASPKAKNSNAHAESNLREQNVTTSGTIKTVSPAQVHEHAQARAARAQVASAINIGKELPWQRMVVIGDSFAEGVGDPEPLAPGGLRGWADRVAEVFASYNPDFAYANLALRGKVINQIIDEQLDAAIELKPDLIFVSAGGNDVLRPNADPDYIAQRLEDLVAKLTAETDASIVLFSAFDVRDTAVFKAVRGKAAIYSQHQRSIAAVYDAAVVHLWGLTEIQDTRYWDEDRLHLNSLGHHTVARAVLDELHVPHNLDVLTPDPLPAQSWREARREDIVWARTHLVPWVLRRLKGVSSGDNLSAKRPAAEPVLPVTSSAQQEN